MTELRPKDRDNLPGESCSFRNSGPSQSMEEHANAHSAAGRARLKEIAMKTILSALVALSVISSVANTASALDAKTFYEQVDRDHN